MPQERIIDTGRVKLNCLDWPGGPRPPLVMLHGGAWRWQEFLSLIPMLARQRHVFAFDLRGNGCSEWAASYRLADFGEDIAEFVRHQDSPLVLMGHSLGGVVALMTAARCPEKVRGLIIEDAPVRVDNYRRMIDSGREMFKVWLELKRGARSEEELARALAEKYCAFPDITSTWILFFAGCLWRVDPAFFNALLDDFDGFVSGYDAEDIFRKTNCPVLVLRGEKERGAVMTDDELSWLQTNFTNISCAAIKNVGHLLHLEAQGQSPVLAEILAFLEQI
jgi:pimeloyl-ACP methyl ester carboxylesterase